MGLDVLTMSVSESNTEDELKKYYTKEEIDAQKPTLLSQELKKGDTSVTFDVPTEGDNFIEIFTSVDGLDYESLDDSTAGKVTITYEAQAKDVTIFLKISGGAE